MQVVSLWGRVPLLGNLVLHPTATISEFDNMKGLFVSGCLVLKSSCKYMRAIGEARVSKK